jgi:hypothetical protein
MIGHGTRGHLQFFNTFGERFDLDSAVEKAVVSMKMEVYELAVLHWFFSFSARSLRPLRLCGVLHG